MSVFKYLLENKLVDDKKEFQELFSVRAIKVDEKYLSDPQQDIKSVKKINIGCLEYILSK